MIIEVGNIFILIFFIINDIINLHHITAINGLPPRKYYNMYYVTYMLYVLCLHVASRWHAVTGDLHWHADWYRVNQP